MNNIVFSKTHHNTVDFLHSRRLTNHSAQSLDGWREREEEEEEEEGEDDFKAMLRLYCTVLCMQYYSVRKGMGESRPAKHGLVLE